jgi:glycosyltransferase involved in cell wall biosynthesis
VKVLGFLTSYRLRMQRKRWRIRAMRKRRELVTVQNRTSQIGRSEILLICTLRDERVRLPFFLQYYRRLGVEHFLFIDNGSTDGTDTYLKDQEDVSLWTTSASYKNSRYGVDWMNWLALRYGHGHWIVTVDIDEFLVYPFCDTRPLQALTDWLDSSSIRSFGTITLDMYPKGPVEQNDYQAGEDPFTNSRWFDSANYSYKRNDRYYNLWIQGGPRARMFFADNPENAPALNKVPLVKWHRDFAYVSSTHMMLPRGLNLVYDQSGGEKASGVLLHAKFLNTLVDKAAQEAKRGEHYAAAREYEAYEQGLGAGTVLWTKWSEEYINWRQLEILGLMSKGNWA